MTPEGKVKAKVRKMLTEAGVYYAMPVTGGFGNSGVPDFLICAQGVFAAIECKANGGKPTALQRKHMDEIEKAGGFAVVIDEKNLDTLKEWLVMITTGSH